MTKEGRCFLLSTVLASSLSLPESTMAMANGVEAAQLAILRLCLVFEAKW
jgi:hypothetical protein